MKTSLGEIRAILKFSAFIFVVSVISSCASYKVKNVIVTTKFNQEQNVTKHLVMPLGSVTLPGQWIQTSYSNNSYQQFFINRDSIEIAIAFNRFNQIEFNARGSKKEFEFVKGFYEWDSQYFVDRFNLNRQIIESDSINKYMLYRIFGVNNNIEIDTYYLIGEKNGNSNSFSINITDKWTEEQKINFLKKLFLSE
jgi:hypothetical protein